MFGSAILDVIIGLVFVYLILSLICSAINEYIASLLNKRGKMLVNGIQILLRDVNMDRKIFDHPLMASHFPHHGTLVERAERIRKWPPGTRWIYRLITWAFWSRIREARYPSYVSARAFATAFLEQAGYVDELLQREEQRRSDAALTATIAGRKTGEGAQDPPDTSGRGADAGAAQGAGSGGSTVSGATGAAGTSGATGGAGTSGSTGGAGTSGTTGGAGTSGDTNASGTTGAAGTPGATGTAPLEPIASGTRAADTSGGSPPRDATPSGARPTDPARGLLSWFRSGGHRPTVAEVRQRAVRAEKTLDELMQTFKRDAALEAQPFPALAGLTAVSSLLPEDEKRKLVDEALRWRNELQSVQTGVETWFNNSMDRVSGAYKRHTQHVLFFIGLIVAFALNADTVDLWRRLSADPKLREGLAAQAAASLPAVGRLASRDTTPGDTAAGPSQPATAPATPPPPPPAGGTDSSGTATGGTAGAGATGGTAGSTGPRTTLSIDTVAAERMRDSLHEAKAMYDSAYAMLQRTTLNFGWSWEDVQGLGFATQLDSARADSVWKANVARDSVATLARLDSAARARPKTDSIVGAEARARTPHPVYAYAGLRHPHWSALWAKLLGLLLTTFALSLGAPFWFDTLNKIINVRAAGRAPSTTPAPTPADGAGSGSGADKDGK
jgi:hypothetical protein